MTKQAKGQDQDFFFEYQTGAYAFYKLIAIQKIEDRS